MRLVRIEDLSEEERKKALEQQQKRLEANRQASEQDRQSTNNRFNELVSRTGGYDLSKHTTNINDIVKSMKNSGASKEKISMFKKNNRATLWDSVLDTANGIGKTAENTWLGLSNGFKSFQQTLGKRITETQSERLDFWNEQNKNTLEKRIMENPEEKGRIENVVNNPLISGEQIREEEKKTTEKIQKQKEDNTEKINNNTESINNPIVKKISELSPSIGQMIPSFIPGFGAVYATGSATGQYYDDAKARGMSDKEANIYSGIMGLAEGGTEMIGIKNLSKAGKGVKALVKGAGKEVEKHITKQATKSVLKNVLKDYGIGIADNVMQEALIDPIQEFTAQVVSGKDKAQWENIGERMLEDGINGGLVSAILGGANIGVQSCTGVIQKFNNNQKITEQEFKKAVKDAGQELDTSKMVLSGVEQQFSKYKDYYSNKQLNTDTQNWLNKAENIINENRTNIANANNINQQQSNMDTSNMTFEDSAKAYNLNTEDESIKSVSNALSSRDILGRFDSSFFKNNNENAIWRTYTDKKGNSKREVIFNPNGNSQTTIQQIGIHELTHDLQGSKEFEELKTLVLDRNKTMQGYTEARQSLENTYSQVYDINSKEFKNLIDEEEVADTLAQKLGDQDFVNSLSTEKPTVFKRIYDWVVDKVNKLTGNKFEKVYWEDIKNKFENAYRQEYQGGNNNQTKYSFIGEKGVNNAIKQEPSTYMTVERGLNKAKQMKETGIDNESIRQNTGWFQDRNGNWKFEISDKNMKLKDNVNLKENTNYKLGDILEHNTLFTMYPELQNIDIEFTDLKNAKGSYNRNKNILKLSNNMLNQINTKKSIEGTMIHEIQHAIQKNEGFERGASAKKSRKLYYESLGEIEADDVKHRFIDEKYNGRNVRHVTPESSKANPKHRYYDTYMKDRGTIDKIKDSMFKYPKKDGSNNEINYENQEQINENKNISNNRRQDNNVVVGRGYGLRRFEEKNQRNRETRQSKKIKGNDNSGKINQESFEQNYTSNRNKNNYEKMEEVKKKSPRKEYDIENGNSNITDNSDTRYSTNTKGAWQEFLDNQIGKRGKGKTIQELRLPTKENLKGDKMNRQANYDLSKDRKILNPTEIANLKQKDAITTPKLPTKKYEKGNKQSSFFSNIVTDSKFLNKDLRQEIGNEKSVRYYEGITNKETLAKSYKKLQEGGEKEVLSWFSKDGKNASAEDVTEGWILLKQYQDSGDYSSAVEVAKKMREIGTKAGQAVQAFNILSRLTPEGMTMYAQKELSEAYDLMVKGKSQKWIDDNASNFDLSPNETAFIKETMEKVSTMEDGYEKKVELAKIQKLITDKIPPVKGQGIKAWMRISMLFNPKTQVRNVAGNAIILPVNMFSDSVSAGVDKLISKKTGMRTTGNTKIKNYTKGFAKGLYESYNDFKLGINTRNIEGNRFEVNEGKSFKDKGIGKALNRVDGLLSFMLDAGDRGFYEATFSNSINNQMVLNETNNITQDMIDIATTEALQRTWQDNNAYTTSVLKIRNILNNVNVRGYGLGDVLIPFAKTPANLTKAIVDYSPVGLTKSLSLDAKRLKNAIDTKQFTPQMQHKFVQNVGKGFAGTFLYVLGYALAKAGVITGEADEDKDVKNFMKNSLGISSYSIKIGDKTFSYDWAQPVATPFTIMSNFVKYDKENPDASAIEKGISALNIGTEQLLEQSFMESLNTVLNGNGSTIENLSQAVFDLPSRAIPTFSKQIADMVDNKQRTSFEYGKPIKSAINSAIAKIPIASKSLAPSIDTLGNEIQKYGGENNFFNVFINPANTNKGKMTKAGKEIYNLYEKTGENRIFPITAPYYINNEGEKTIMDSKQRAEYQRITGNYTEKAIDELLSNDDYKRLSTDDKVNLIADIISDSNNRAKYEILKIETEEAQKKRDYINKIGTKAYYDYKFKTNNIEGENANKKKMKVLEDAEYSNEVKDTIYENTLGKNDENYKLVYKKSGININEYLKYKQQEFESDKEDDGTVEGKSVTNSKKKKVYNYVNNMNITYNQKLLILGNQYKLTDNEQKKLYSYINNMPNQTSEEKLEIFKKYSKNFEIYKNGKLAYK